MCSSMKQLVNCLAALTLAFGLAIAGAGNAEAVTSLTFEGYKVGDGAPPEGGVIASIADGPQDPWFGSYAYHYLDGWNHNPRVDPDQYDGVGETQWLPGGHAGTGTAAQGWTSLLNGDPGRYVYDFQGYEFDHNFYYWEANGIFPGDPKYGHEDRWYQRMAGGGEGTWEIFDTGPGGGSVASGTLGDSFYMDIFYDPLNGGANAYIAGKGTITAVDDGGAFYTELMTRWGSPVLNFTTFTAEPPVQAENWGAPLGQQWAIYGSEITVTAVPEPASMLLYGIGVLGLGFYRRRKS